MEDSEGICMGDGCLGGEEGWDDGASGYACSQRIGFGISIRTIWRWSNRHWMKAGWILVQPLEAGGYKWMMVILV